MGFEQYWELIVFIIALLFNAGVMFKTYKDKPSEKRVSEMIDEKFQDHCPFTEKIAQLETNKKEMNVYRETLARNLQKENESTHLSLQRVELNLKRVCDKLELGYLE